MNARTRVWHPDWCAQNHTCTAAMPGGEHRADPIGFHLPGAGSVLMTRIRSAGHGTDHAEIRLSVVLPVDEPNARARLTALLTHLQVLVGPAR